MTDATVSETAGRTETAPPATCQSAQEIISLRRSIHRHPEPAFVEIRTAALILGYLERLPCRISMGERVLSATSVPDYPSKGQLDAAVDAAVAAGIDPGEAARIAEAGTALVAEIDGNRPGPAWAFRFDMDALPIRESQDPGHRPFEQGFASVNGNMHACAHDGHVAVGVALATRLSDGNFAGSVKIVFQPAEEGCRGAAGMIAAGVGLGIDRFVGLHLGNSMPAGSVAGSAYGLLATTKLRIRFEGLSAHAGSAPSHGRNALLAAATATLNLHAISRFAGHETRINVGRLTAGDAANVIAGSAEMSMEVRADDGDVNDELVRRTRRIVESAAEMHEVSATVFVVGSATSFCPDDEIVDEVVAAAQALGVQDRRSRHLLTSSDDFSLWGQKVQQNGGRAAFVLVGGGNTLPHHHPEFDIDESCLPIAADVLERLVRR
ncbi:amidohydrolase [Arthrobacter sp. UYEF3]|uniref:amidohydrolase n=1 Tax=Arthrobacter sp. UYEF3 TaxID=1756365 RepID=UPI00339B04E7